MSKVWVVNLKNKHMSDKKLVRAKTQSGAVHTARLNSFMRGARTASYSVRVADPIRDLGCVEL